jgi:hypothetical protein
MRSHVPRRTKQEALLRPFDDVVQTIGYDDEGALRRVVDLRLGHTEVAQESLHESHVLIDYTGQPLVAIAHDEPGRTEEWPRIGRRLLADALAEGNPHDRQSARARSLQQRVAATCEIGTPCARKK